MITVEQNGTYSTITNVFDKVQESSAMHQICIGTLQEIYKNCDFNEFMENIKRCLEVMLQVETKPHNPFYERLMEFTSLFFSSMKSNDVSEDDEECVDHPLVTEIFRYLMKTQELSSETVRYRSCQIMNKMLDAMVGLDLSEQLCEDITNTMLDRLQDPKFSVRIECIKVLSHLQDPENPIDEVIKSFVDSMNTDSCAEVRALAIKKISVRRNLIPHILQKTEDISADVRFAAYSKLSKLVKSLKIKQRHMVILNGFADSSEKIKDFISQHLLLDWLQQYEYDYLHLIKAIRLDASSSDCENTVEVSKHILTSLFKVNPIEEIIAVLTLNNRVIQFENLSFETIIYWRFLIEHFRQDVKYENFLEEILPELVYFCVYIEDYWNYILKKQELTETKNMEFQFILKQMFLITQGYDFSDIATSKSLIKLVSTFAKDRMVKSGVTSVIIKNLEFCIPDVEPRINFVCELISDIMCPLQVDEKYEKLCREKDFKLAQLTTKLHFLINDQEKAINEERFLDAAKLNKDIDEVKASLADVKSIVIEDTKTTKTDDLSTIDKCLDIMIELLSSPQINQWSSTLESLQKNFLEEVLPYLNNITVNSKVLKCYVLFCILNRKTAIPGIHICAAPILKYKTGEECDISVLVVAICGVTDMLLLYGSDIITTPENKELSNSMSEEHRSIFLGGTSLTLLIRGLVELMQDDAPEVQECAGEALCKLISHGCIYSALVISHLIIKWSSPSTTNNLRHYIGYALQNLPELPKTINNIEKAVIPTLKTLLNAPDSSPLAEVDINNIGKFMLSLCSCYKEGLQIQSNLAMNFLQEMQKETQHFHVLTYSKMLLLLELNKDQFFVRDILKLCDEIKKENYGRQVLNNLNKFIANLTTNLTISDVIIESNKKETETESVITEQNFND